MEGPCSVFGLHFYLVRQSAFNYSMAHAKVVKVPYDFIYLKL